VSSAASSASAMRALAALPRSERSFCRFHRMTSGRAAEEKPASERSATVSSASGSSPEGKRPTSSVDGDRRGGVGHHPRLEVGGRHDDQAAVDALEAAQHLALILDVVLRTGDGGRSRGAGSKRAERGRRVLALHGEHHDVARADPHLLGMLDDRDRVAATALSALEAQP